MVSPLSRVWQHVKLSDVSLGTRPRYSLVVDEDIKKPTNQTNKIAGLKYFSMYSKVFYSNIIRKSAQQCRASV